MKVLVSGAQGQVGTELILQGEALGLQMIATERDDMDITRKEEVSACFSSQRPDIVINAAAYTAVDKAEEESDLAYAINRDGVANLAAACAQHGIPLLHISTDYIFDGTEERPYCEDDAPNPQGVYGKSKLEGEIVVEETLAQYINLRVAWVFGAAGHNFVRTMLRLGNEREELRVVADQQGGPTWSGDIASVLLIIAERYQKGATIPWGTYHYVGKPATSWHGFAQVIFDTAIIEGMLKKVPKVKAITTADYPTPAERPRNSVLDCHKIERELGISQPDWRIGLINVLKNWKQR